MITMLKSPIVVQSLITFLSRQISERGINYLIPLESKGALLLDLALEALPAGDMRPEILYLRSLDYLSMQNRATITFGVFDDFVFSGRTIGRALDSMARLNIPREHIHPMAFFKFLGSGPNEDVCSDILASIEVPGDGALLSLSQDQVLREVQTLAAEHKIPASYDNLHWDQTIAENDYALLMRDLAKTGWFLQYGQRGNIDASALLVRTESSKSFSVTPKIRFWYDRSNCLLRVAPLSFAKAGKSRFAHRCARLSKILTPEQPTPRQCTFATYQAQVISEQVALLGYLKPYFQNYKLTPKLDNKHIRRYFGPRADQVINYLEESYQRTPQLSIPTRAVIMGRRLDFYWVAVDIMRALGKAYWTQPPPRKESHGFSVAELIEQFSGTASVEAVHTAIDYCADMNFIATFFGWKKSVPFRAFRLTENGEREVGRNDGPNHERLTFIEKLGAVILSKSKDHEAHWWVLDKMPALLIRRFKFRLPQMEAAVDYFGDTTQLRPRENSANFLTWPQLKTVMWTKRDAPGARRDSKAQIFTLSADRFAEYRDDIFNDPEIIKVLGPMEILLEFTKNKTMGHHVAILVDILSDHAGGTTYLANAMSKSVDLMGNLDVLVDADDKMSTSREINEWLSGLDEKIVLLMEKSKTLFKHMNFTVKRLTRQGRGELATQLVQIVPFPQGNKIIPAFRDLSLILKRLGYAMQRGDSRLINEIEEELVIPRTLTATIDENKDSFSRVELAINRWGAALSGAIQDVEVYNNARLNVATGEVHRMYIVAYDLIGSSGGQYDGRTDADRDRHVQSVIMNWFIAFGGYAQRPEFGGGDLGFGFFHSAKTAVQASLWAGYHLELLKKTNPLLMQEKPHAGFGIVQDDMNSGFMEQIKSDWLSKFAKAWKHEAERIADNAGRLGRPIVAFHDDMFSGIRELPAAWLGDNGVLDKIPVRFIRNDAMSNRPWECWDSAYHQSR